MEDAIAGPTNERKEMKMTIKFLHRVDAAIFFDPELSDRELCEVASQNLLDKVCTRLT